MRKSIIIAAVIVAVCTPYTLFPGQSDWYKLDASWAAGHSGGHSSKVSKGPKSDPDSKGGKSAPGGKRAH